MTLRNTVFSALASLSLAACSHGVEATLTTASLQAQTAAKVDKTLKMPFNVQGAVKDILIGHAQYCTEHPKKIACKDTPSNESTIISYAQWEKTLFEGNLLINAAITPKTDLEIYGIAEKWASLLAKIEKGREAFGDCEDYVLTKMEFFFYHKGIPISAMHIAALLDENNDYHAVLMIATDRGFVMLDNKIDTPIVFKTHQELYENSHKYRFIAITTSRSPKEWIDIQQQKILAKS